MIKRDQVSRSTEQRKLPVALNSLLRWVLVSCLPTPGAKSRIRRGPPAALATFSRGVCSLLHQEVAAQYGTCSRRGGGGAHGELLGPEHPHLTLLAPGPLPPAPTSSRGRAVPTGLLFT